MAIGVNSFCTIHTLLSYEHSSTFSGQSCVNHTSQDPLQVAMLLRSSLRDKFKWPLGKPFLKGEDSFSTHMWPLSLNPFPTWHVNMIRTETTKIEKPYAKTGRREQACNTEDIVHMKASHVLHTLDFISCENFNHSFELLFNCRFCNSHILICPPA